MIAKENLLGLLKKSLANEGEFIARCGKDFLQSLAKMEAVDEEEKKEVTNLLTDLLEDTKRHEKIIASLAHDIEEDSRNEY